METDKFYIKIVGIIFSTSTRKILIGKAKGENKYSFLEGSLTQDEDLDLCLKRTVTKKTGYKVHNLGAIYSENNLTDKSKIKLHFLCEIKGGEEEKGENIEDMIWVKPSEIEEKLEVKLPSRLHEYITNLE